MKRYFLLVAPLLLAACITQPPAPVASPEAVLKAQAQPGNGTLLPQPDTPPVGAVAAGGGALIPQPDTPPVAAAAAAAGMAKNAPTEEATLAQGAAADTAIGAALIGNDSGGLQPVMAAPAAGASAAPSSEPSATPTPGPTSTPSGK